MSYCLEEIHQLRNLSKTEREFNHAYCNIVNKHEDFMCSLLDMVSKVGSNIPVVQMHYHTL